MTEKPSTNAVVRVALSKVFVQLAIAAQAARTARNEDMADKIVALGLALEAVYDDAAGGNRRRTFH